MDTKHNRQGSSGRCIGPSQRHLPTQHKIFTRENINAPSGIRTSNPSKRAATRLRFEHRGHHDRLINYSPLQFIFHGSTALVGQGRLIVEASRSHSDTPHSVGLLWTSDQPDTETSTWQHTTLTRARYPCPRRDSNPQANGIRSTP
jgi:hypothetical protein